MKPNGELPTLLLTERRATICRLARQDVDFLLGVHRAHVELIPGERGGDYRLTPRGYVGTIVCPRCRLVIRPKIPIKNLFYLLDPTGPIPLVPDQITPLPAAATLDFLAGRLAHLLDERAAAGLHRAYQERAERQPFLQGQLDLPAHLRGGNACKNQLSCRYDEFTPDVACNQIPKATAELLLRSPLLGDGVRRSLQAFAAVTTIPVDRHAFSTALTDRLTEAYRPLLDLCRILVDSLAPAEQSGSVPCPAFLVDMDRVFERYVTAGLTRAYVCSPGVTVSLQPVLTANRPDASLPDIHLCPDFTVAAGGRPLLVGDAKWKCLPAAPLLSADLYQVITYGTALGIRRGLLVYPGSRDRLWSYVLAGAPVRIDIRTLRVTGKRAACARSLDRLAGAVRSAVRSLERLGPAGKACQRRRPDQSPAVASNYTDRAGRS